MLLKDFKEAYGEYFRWHFSGRIIICIDSIMGDPKHSRHEEIKRWADSQLYRDFDIELVNRRLRYALRG